MFSQIWATSGRDSSLVMGLATVWAFPSLDTLVHPQQCMGLGNERGADLLVMPGLGLSGWLFSHTAFLLTQQGVNGEGMEEGKRRGRGREKLNPDGIISAPGSSCA